MKLHKILSLILVFAFLMSLVACARRPLTEGPTAPVSDPAGTTEPVGTTEPDSTTVVPPTTDEPNPPTPGFNAGLYDWIIDEELQNYTGTVRVYSAFKLTQGMQQAVEEFNTY